MGLSLRLWFTNFGGVIQPNQHEIRVVSVEQEDAFRPQRQEQKCFLVVRRPVFSGGEADAEIVKQFLTIRNCI